jgi:hypothetical protein
MRSAWSIEGCRSLGWHIGTIFMSIGSYFDNMTMCRVSFFGGQLRKPKKKSQMLTAHMTAVATIFTTHRIAPFTARHAFLAAFFMDDQIPTSLPSWRQPSSEALALRRPL